MSALCLFGFSFAVGLALGYTLAAGYYATLVQRAFGLSEEVSVVGWLQTKATKRKIDKL